MGGVFRSQRHKTLFDGELTILEIFKPFSLTKIVIDRGITTSSSCMLQSIIGCQWSASPTHYSLSPIPLDIATMVIPFGTMSCRDSLTRQVALEDVWMTLDMLRSFC